MINTPIIKIDKNKIIKLENKSDLASILINKIENNDIILCVGAGDITNMARNLEKELKEITN